MTVIRSEDTITYFDPSLIIGPVQIGALITAALFGCLLIQSYVYFTKFVDNLGFKVTVAAVIMLQLGHFLTVTSTLWTMTVIAYDDPSKLSALPVSADITVLLSSCTAFLTQSFYIYRLWKLSGKVYLPILSGILCVAAQVATVFLVTKAIPMTSVALFVAEQTDTITIVFAGRAFCDITITLCITWSLIQKRGRGIASSTTTIDYLILWTIENGLATSLVTLSVVAAFLPLKGSMVWFGLYLIYPNVVANGLLVSLNRRLGFRKESLPTTSDSIHMNSVVIRVDVARAQAADSEIKTQISF